MKHNHWDDLARENAEYYICPSETDYSTPEGRRHFFAEGQLQVDRLLEDIGQDIRSHRRALEIGCGVGRLAIPMSQHFDRLSAVDVAPRMLKALAKNCSELGINSIDHYLPHEPWENDSPFDLVYSCLVFQHIESWDVISDYVHRIAKCLDVHGVCYLHFDTRHPDVAYWARGLLPDRFLRKPWRRGIRRVRRRRSNVRRLIRQAGLTVVREYAPDSTDHVLIVCRAHANP
jgi:cyclopropane fatty-acyl-phospholipid synthase-like methyltransferase